MAVVYRNTVQTVKCNARSILKVWFAVTHMHFTDQVKHLCAFIYLFLILFLISLLFNRQIDINECLPMYVHELVAFFFNFSKKWTADSEKQEIKLVWPKCRN